MSKPIHNRSPYNPASELFKKLTRLLSGPLVNYKAATERAIRRKQMDKYANAMQTSDGKSFKKQNFSMDSLQSSLYLNHQRNQRYVEFCDMEYSAEVACVTGDTKIAALEGFVTIEKLCEKYPNGESFEVWSWDRDKCQYSIGSAHHPRKTGTKKVIKVNLDNGRYFECTPDHRIMLIDGTYKEAQYLETNDSLMPFDFTYGKGYLRIKDKVGGKFKNAHKYIFENIFEQDTKEKNIHHKNRNKLDNRVVNLQSMTVAEHASEHNLDICFNGKRRKDCLSNWNEMSEAQREERMLHLREWQKSEEGHMYMSEHTSMMNKKRWAEDEEYALKMAQMSSFRFKKLWDNPEWKEWKRKQHSQTIKLKLANDPEYKSKIRRSGDENGRFYDSITNERVLLEGLKYERITDFARSLDIEGREYDNITYKTQFVRRRLKACGYNGWEDYKNRYQYSNHKVVSIEDCNKVVDVYDLTVDHYENFALHCGAIISNSVLDVYSEEMTVSSKIQKMLSIDCSNEEIKEVLRVLYYDILNIEFNLPAWSRNLCKYGDAFLYLDIEEGQGIKRVIGLPVADVERLEGQDKLNPDYVQFQVNVGGLTLENWQVAHFRILGNDKYSPYGTSILDPARRIYRQLELIETAMMAYRVVRSPERRVFYVDVGNVPPQDVEQYIQHVMTQMKKNQMVNTTDGTVDLRFNPMSITDDFFIPVRGGTSGTKIESLPGGSYVGDIDDVKYLRDKLFTALKMPASYISRAEGAEEDKASLSQKDIRFARTISRLQKSLISELTKIGLIHLYVMGYRNEDLLSFDLSLNNPSKIAELQELELWRTKFDVAAAATEGFFSKRWIVEKIFSISEEEFLRCQREMYYDKWMASQLGALEEGGEGGGGLGGDLEDMGSDGGDIGEELEEPEETSEEDEILLAEPGKGKRDEPYLTPGAKGKLYTPVSSDHRDSGARKRHFQSQFSKEMASNTPRNIFKGYDSMKSLGKGIAEQNETNYIEEENTEGKILNTNYEVKQILEKLEKRYDKKEK